MVLLKDFPADGSVIPFASPAQRTTALYVVLPEIAIAIIVDLILIVALMKQRQIPMDTQFIISLSFADILFSSMFLILVAGEVYFDGWWIGVLGCIWNEVLIVLTLGASIVSIFAMTLHRYLIVAYQYHMSQREVSITLVSIWIGLVGIDGLFVLLQDEQTVISLQPSHYYCFIAMESTDTVNVLATSLVLFFIMGTMVFMIFAYFFIVKRYLDLQATLKRKREEVSVQKNAGRHANQEEKELALQLEKEKSISENELKLIKKAIAIAGSFVGVWIFFIGKCLYESINRKPVSIAYDTFVGILFTANPILNGIILYLYDAKCRNNIRELFFYKKPLSSVLRSQRRRAASAPIAPRVENHYNETINLNATKIIPKVDIQRPLDTVKVKR